MRMWKVLQLLFLYNYIKQRTYLSHPALYTHVKIKHNGIFPEGVILPT